MPPRAHTALAVSLSLALAALLAGCGKGDGASPDGDVVIPSTYALATIDGDSLPAVVQNASTGTARSIIADTLVLEAEGLFLERVHFRESNTARAADANGVFGIGTGDTTHFAGGILNGSGSAPRRTLSVQTVPDALHGAHRYDYRRISP